MRCTCNVISCNRSFGLPEKGTVEVGSGEKCGQGARKGVAARVQEEVEREKHENVRFSKFP